MKKILHLLTLAALAVTGLLWPEKLAAQNFTPPASTFAPVMQSTNSSTPGYLAPGNYVLGPSTTLTLQGGTMNGTNGTLIGFGGGGNGSANISVNGYLTLLGGHNITITDTANGNITLPSGNGTLAFTKTSAAGYGILNGARIDSLGALLDSNGQIPLSALDTNVVMFGSSDDSGALTGLAGTFPGNPTGEDGSLTDISFGAGTTLVNAVGWYLQVTGWNNNTNSLGATAGGTGVNATVNNALVLGNGTTGYKFQTVGNGVLLGGNATGVPSNITIGSGLALNTGNMTLTASGGGGGNTSIANITAGTAQSGNYVFPGTVFGNTSLAGGIASNPSSRAYATFQDVAGYTSPISTFGNGTSGNLYAYVFGGGNPYQPTSGTNATLTINGTLSATGNMTVVAANQYQVGTSVGTIPAALSVNGSSMFASRYGESDFINYSGGTGANDGNALAVGGIADAAVRYLKINGKTTQFAAALASGTYTGIFQEIGDTGATFNVGGFWLNNCMNLEGNAPLNPDGTANVTASPVGVIIGMANGWNGSWMEKKIMYSDPNTGDWNTKFQNRYAQDIIRITDDSGNTFSTIDQAPPVNAASTFVAYNFWSPQFQTYWAGTTYYPSNYTYASGYSTQTPSTLVLNNNTSGGINLVSSANGNIGIYVGGNQSAANVRAQFGTAGESLTGNLAVSGNATVNGTASFPGYVAFTGTANFTGATLIGISGGGGSSLPTINSGTALQFLYNDGSAPYWSGNIGFDSANSRILIGNLSANTGIGGGAIDIWPNAAQADYYHTASMSFHSNDSLGYPKYSYDTIRIRSETHSGFTWIYGFSGYVDSAIAIHDSQGLYAIFANDSYVTGNTFVSIGGNLDYNNAPIAIDNNTAVNGTLLAAGNMSAPAFNVVSDARFKTERSPLPFTADKFLQLKPTAYHFTKEFLAAHPTLTDSERHGLYAQEIAAIDPSAAHFDAEKQDGFVDMYALLADVIAGEQDIYQRQQRLDWWLGGVGFISLLALAESLRRLHRRTRHLVRPTS